jgi:hypothetical protein
VAGLAVLAGLAGPAAYAVDTTSTPHSGAIPSAGPPVAGGFGPTGGGGRGGFRPRFGQGLAPGFGQQAPGGLGALPGGGFTGGAPGGQGGLGGLLDTGTPDAALVSLLSQDTTSTWAAAAVGANSAAGVQLASGRPVMAIGGFNGSDPSPTLAQFQADVAAGRIHYFLAGGGFGRGGFGAGGGSNTASQIANWVESSFPSTTVGGVTVYDLTQPSSGSATGSVSAPTT